jgi:hypothetical protein
VIFLGHRCARKCRIMGMWGPEPQEGGGRAFVRPVMTTGRQIPSIAAEGQEDGKYHCVWTYPWWSSMASSEAAWAGGVSGSLVPGGWNVGVWWGLSATGYQVDGTWSCCGAKGALSATGYGAVGLGRLAGMVQQMFCGWNWPNKKPNKKPTKWCHFRGSLETRTGETT